MERSDPVLVPQWLRCAGNLNGDGTSVHHSDVPSSVHSAPSRSFRSNNGKNSPRFLGRSSSSNPRLNSNSNESTKHPYSSFTRSQRDKNRDREKEKPLLEDIWDHDSPDPLSSILTNRDSRSAFRRSHSTVSRKLGEVLSPKVEDSKNDFGSLSNGNGVSGTSNAHGIQKSAFEKDFPSLRTEEKQGVTGIRRILSPGLGPSVQGLSIGKTGFLGVEKWTSALAEVPSIVISNGTGQSPAQHSYSASSTSASGTSNTSGLNMAEALTQSPARVRATHQLPDKSQRLEELAIKQSRQLIPMTPSTPKPLVPSSVDKSKQPKVPVRANENIVPSRAVQPQPHSSHLSNQSLAGQIRSDSTSTPHVGKFVVLKPGRENGPNNGTKEAYTPTGDNNSRLSNGQLAIAPPTPTASISPNNSMVSTFVNKTAKLSLSSRSNVDKRLSQSVARSRSEFFNLMRRKASNITATDVSKLSSAVTSRRDEASVEIFKEDHVPVNSYATENGGQIIFNHNGHSIPEKTTKFSDEGENKLSGNGEIYPDEEEAAFLRSLGWDENGGEDEELTEEEINAFYQEYMNKRPSAKVHPDSEPKCSTPSEFQKTISDVASESSSSESDSET